MGKLDTKWSKLWENYGKLWKWHSSGQNHISNQIQSLESDTTALQMQDIIRAPFKTR